MASIGDPCSHPSLNALIRPSYAHVRDEPTARVKPVTHFGKDPCGVHYGFQQFCN